MPLPQRLFSGDVEHGKKDDDHKPATSPFAAAWRQRPLAGGPQRRSLKRAALGLLALVAVYYFFKNMPTDLENPVRRPSYNPPTAPQTHSDTRPAHPPPHQGTKPEGKVKAPPLHDYNGPIKFYHLAVTLHAVSSAGGFETVNKNVLFAAASLKSASILLPIACDMALRERNQVHFALMGRDDISMDILKAVNGVEDGCKIHFHDARPDFSPESSDFRMEVSSAAAYNHINNFVHPQATFIDASGEEEVWLSKGIKLRAKSVGRTVIELPANAEQNLMWITLLDSASLSAWNQVSVDIIVHAQASASGSLMRLLDSLKKADFFSSAPPRLTIELPHIIEQPTKSYLEKFAWPPHADANTGSLLTLHHRIPQKDLTADENAIRMLESFWPADPFTSHVLVLSPQSDLSPLFFHYIKYAILEYRHSATTAATDTNLLGISLDLPTTYLNDSTKFEPPFNTITKDNDISNTVTPFLWQAPNSNAQLYFGDKWVELHDFVAQLFASPSPLPKKLVSKAYPSWLEHVLKLVRVRGYWTLYPNFPNHDSLSTLHTDLYKPPEEYSQAIKEEEAQKGELTADPADHKPLKYAETTLIKTPLLSILPKGGVLPSIKDMPLLSWDGQHSTMDAYWQSAIDYVLQFKRDIGGCNPEAADKPRYAQSAADLFCFNDDPAELKKEVPKPVEEMPEMGRNFAVPGEETIRTKIKETTNGVGEAQLPVPDIVRKAIPEQSEAAVPMKKDENPIAKSTQAALNKKEAVAVAPEEEIQKAVSKKVEKAAPEKDEAIQARAEEDVSASIQEREDTREV